MENEKLEDKKGSKKEAKTKKEKTDKEIIQELTETLQRLQAEFENYRKRTEKEKCEFVKCSNAQLIEKLLPVLDSFELAIKNHTDHEKFVKGVEMIYAQLFSALESEGLKPVECLGKKFDPYLHEALMHGSSEKEEGTITEEFQKGYMLNGNILRHSKVKICKK